VPVRALEGDDRRLVDENAAGLHAGERVGRDVVRAIAARDDVVWPLAQQQRDVLAANAGRQAFTEAGDVGPSPSIPVASITVRVGSPDERCTCIPGRRRRETP
jgi:hypothetical protein